jgi:hypothetical protein
LTDVPGFPTIISGNADNDPTRYFIAGTLNQRPSLNMIGSTVIAGFGGHCDNFNYTGYLVGMSKTTGGKTAMMAMMASPGAPSPQPLNIMSQTGGKAGIWQSGTGLAADTTNNRVFFVTGYVYLVTKWRLGSNCIETALALATMVEVLLQAAKQRSARLSKRL